MGLLGYDEFVLFLLVCSPNFPYKVGFYFFLSYILAWFLS